MDILSIAILAVSVIFLLSGTLYGLKRGAIKSAVRLGIVVASFLVAWLSKTTCVELVLSIEIDGEPLLETLAVSFAQLGALSEIANALLESILGILLFVIVFIALKIVTAIIFFIIGFFLPKGHRGIGALIGLVQGALIAFCICAPLNGLLCDVGRFMSLEIGDEAILPEDTKEEMAEAGLDFDEYRAGFISNLYSEVGGGFYNNLATVEKNGVRISLPGTIEAIEVGAKFVDTFASLGDGKTNNAEILKKFKELNDLKESMSDEGNETLNALISVLLESGSDGNSEISEFFSDIDFSEIDFEHEGEVYVALTDFLNDDNPDSKDAKELVEVLADSEFFLPMLEETYSANDISLSKEQKNEISSALDRLDDEEAAEKIRECFGLD